MEIFLKIRRSLRSTSHAAYVRLLRRIVDFFCVCYHSLKSLKLKKIPKLLRYIFSIFLMTSLQLYQEFFPNSYTKRCQMKAFSVIKKRDLNGKENEVGKSSNNCRRDAGDDLRASRHFFSSLDGWMKEDSRKHTIRLIMRWSRASSVQWAHTGSLMRLRVEL